ncbi:MAG: class I SAM-dependent methyltransferase [Anaerolineae bacterium]
MAVRWRQRRISVVDRTSQMELLVSYYLGYLATHLIRLGVDSGLFAALAAHTEGTTADELGHEMRFNTRYVEHFLRGGYALQLLDYDPAAGRYRLAAHMGVLLAEPENFRYVGNLAHLYILAGRDFSLMPGFLKTGATYPFEEHDEDLIEAAANATNGLATFVAKALVRRLPGLKGRDDVAALDIGCGAGGMIVALARAFPRGRVVGIDIEPRSVEMASARIRATGLEGRAEARLAAAEDLDESSAYDLVTMMQVLHETRQEVRDTILERAHGALRPGGVLLIIDEPYPHDKSSLPKAPAAALTQFVEIFMGNVLLSPESQKQLVEDWLPGAIADDTSPRPHLHHHCPASSMMLACP